MDTKTTRTTAGRDHLRLIQAKVPPSLLAAIDAAVATEDTDRSKFMRQALRKAVSAKGIKC